MAWDPTAVPATKWFDIESSRDEQGVAQGRVLLSKWNAGKRLAYENGTLDAVKMDIGPDGAKIRRILPGKISLLALRLTVVGSEGFKDDADFSDEDWVGTLDDVTFSEVLSLATAYQPLPTSAVSKPQDRKAPAEPGPSTQRDREPEDDEGDGDAEDPTRKPSTPEA